MLWLLYGSFSVIAIGATAMVARHVGAGKYREARRVTTQAFLLGLSIALVVTTGGLLWSDQMIRILQLEGESAQLAREYIRYVLPVVPLIMVDAVGVACLRAAGDMMAGLMIMTVVNLVNVSLCWTFCLGALETHSSVAAARRLPILSVSPILTLFQQGLCVLR